MKNKKYKITKSIVLLLIFIVITGQSKQINPEEKYTPVKGVVTVSKKINVAVDIIARVRKISFKEGEVFKKGDTLVEFDCTQYNAEFNIADAEYKAQKIIYQNNDELYKKGAIGANERELSAIDVTKAEAKKNALNAKIKQCIFNAPYDGKIAQIHIREHEMSYSSDPLMRIIDHKNLEIDLIIPSKWITKIKPKQKFMFLIEETKKKYQAEIQNIAAEVDPISQTIQINAVFVKRYPQVTPGMSGEAQFNIIEDQ